MASSILQRVIGIVVLIALFLAALYFKPIEGFVIQVTGEYDQICPVNSQKVSYDPDTFVLTCKLCPQGKKQDPTDDTKCIPIASCSPNEYLNDKYMCVPCPTGQRSLGGGATTCTSSCLVGEILVNDACVACPTGQTSEGGTATTCSPLSCLANFQPSGNTCTKCALNQSSSGGTSMCTNLSCPNGKVPNNHECESCPIGNYTSTGPNGTTTCQECNAGTYQDVQGQNKCKSCPTGSYTSTTGASSCEQCQQGEYQDSEGQSKCNKCPVGFYQDYEGKSRCKPCPENMYSDTTGSTSCSQCPPGSQTESTGSTSADQCLTTMSTKTCTDLYLAKHLSFNEGTDPTGSTLYYELTPDNFSLTSDSSSTPNNNKDDNISKCVLNKRLQNRSSICKQNSAAACPPSRYNSSSLLQAYEFTNAKGICVDKKGDNIPYPATLPPKTIGSADSVLAHIVGCMNPNDAKTCTYQYLYNGAILNQNPCIAVNKIYDFDVDLCVNPSSATSSGCENYQVYDNVTGRCHDVIKPLNSLPPNTTGLLKNSDYRDCVTTDKGDCTVVYRSNTAQSAMDASTNNPCPPSSLPSYTVYDFNKNECVQPSRSGFQNYRLDKPIIMSK